MEILLAHGLAHGRRQFVEVAQNFPDEYRYVLESLGDLLHGWLEAQLADRKLEPNSGLGKAITYLLRHWKGLTAFLRQAGAPLDNNICERALKRAVLHRKNALFYKAHSANLRDARFPLTCLRLLYAR